MLSLLDEVRFEEMIIPDHVPHVEGDSDWETRGRANAVGYLTGMITAIRHEQDD